MEEGIHGPRHIGDGQQVCTTCERQRPKMEIVLNTNIKMLHRGTCAVKNSLHVYTFVFSAVKDKCPKDVHRACHKISTRLDQEMLS